MPTITIKISPDEEMEVDKMEEGEDGSMCPLATQDEELNAENRQECIDEANYRDSTSNSSVAFRADEACGNCGAYNQTEEVMDCIGDETGNTGYCQKWKFCCESDNTCDSWVTGGPITSKKQPKYKEYL